jgi:hypothetical protein
LPLATLEHPLSGFPLSNWIESYFRKLKWPENNSRGPLDQPTAGQKFVIFPSDPFVPDLFGMLSLARCLAGRIDAA